MMKYLILSVLAVGLAGCSPKESLRVSGALKVMDTFDCHSENFRLRAEDEPEHYNDCEPVESTEAE